MSWPGGQQPPPMNAPRAVELGVGVQPGTPNIIRARLVVIFGTADGLFVYSGAPAAGNPPIASITENTADPYSNTTVGDIVSYSAPVAGVQQYSRLTGGRLQFGNITGGVAAGQGELEGSSDGAGNIQVLSGVLVGTDATGGPPHVAAETWHSLGTLAGYTVTAGRYRRTPEGEVELDIDVLPGGANASTTAFSNTLDTAYRPPSSRPFPVAYDRNVTAGDTWPHIQVTNAGVVNVVVQANIGTQISCNQRYPLS